MKRSGIPAGGVPKVSMATISVTGIPHLGMGAFDLGQPTSLSATSMPGLRFASSQPTAAYLQEGAFYEVMQEVYSQPKERFM